VELDDPAIGVGAEELMPALDRPLAHVAVGYALGVEARPHRRDVVHPKGEVSGAERVHRQPVARGEAGVIRDEVVLVAPAVLQRRDRGVVGIPIARQLDGGQLQQVTVEVGRAGDVAADRQVEVVRSRGIVGNSASSASKIIPAAPKPPSTLRTWPVM
jgi:hypothetical protein